MNGDVSGLLTLVLHHSSTAASRAENEGVAIKPVQ